MEQQARADSYRDPGRGSHEYGRPLDSAKSARSGVSSSPRSARLKSPKPGKEGFIPAWRLKSIQDMEAIRARKRELGNTCLINARERQSILRILEAGIFVDMEP
jgi:hypothetical protein